MQAVTVAQAALTSSGVGAVLSGGMEAVISAVKLANDEIDGEEFAGNVVRETVGGGISAAAGTAAATVVGTGAAAALASVSAPLWVPGAIAVGAAVAVGSGIKALWDFLWE